MKRGARFAWRCTEASGLGKRRVIFDKPPTTIESQADLMVKRGLVVTDRERLLRELQTIGYYRLSAYWLPFEIRPQIGQTRSKRFCPGTRHEDVIDLYIFDRKLRLMVMEAIERIEVALRASWTNSLALAHGAHAHLDPRLFKDPWVHAQMLAKLVMTLQGSQETYVKHYREKYTEPFMPPLWVVTEKMSIGELSKWFEATKNNKVRDHVAKNLGLPSKEVADGVIQTLAYVRNLCAHHSRLWNRRFVKRLPNIKRLRSDIITDAINPNKTENLIYNICVICIHMLRTQSPQTSYARRLTDLIETVGDNRHDAMGFPRNWRMRSPWRQDE